MEESRKTKQNEEFVSKRMPKHPEEIITNPEQLAECCRHLDQWEQLGFDTEFVGEQTYHPSLCLIQIATPEKLLIIDPFTVGSLDALWDVILNPSRTIIVHAGREEVRLCQLWTGQVPENLFDLQIAAGLVGLTYPLGHGALVQQMLQIRLRKGETLTEWRDRPLTDEQIRYAFDDVRYLIPLWSKLHQRLVKLDRLDWAREEFSRLATTSTDVEEVEEKYRRLKGVGSLDRRKLAILRALHQWREEKAEELNRPARALVRDDLLIEISKRIPAREEDLQVIRGLARRYMREMVQVVAEAVALPPSDHPPAIVREQVVPVLNHMSQILAAVVGDWCARHKVAQGLVVNSRDLKELVRVHRQGQGCPEELILSQGWRSRHLLPLLEAMLQGKATLRIADVTSDMPFRVE